MSAESISKCVEYLQNLVPPLEEGPSKDHWEITLREGARTTLKMDVSVAVTRAYLTPSSDKGGDSSTSVMIQCNNDAEFTLCSLSSVNQKKSFNTGIYKRDEVTFSINGKGDVRLTGHVLVEDDLTDDDDGDDEMLMAAIKYFQNERKHSEKGNDASGSKKRKEPYPVKDSKKSRVEYLRYHDDTEDDTEDDTKNDTKAS